MINEVLDWIEATGPWNVATLAPLVVALNLVGFPATILSAICGFLLHPLIAIPTAALARSSAALLAWHLSRRVLGKRAQRFIANRERLAALDRALAEGGVRDIALLRLSPLFPSAVTNLALGLTRARPAPIFFGTLLGTLPNTICAVFLGAGLHHLADLDDAEGSPRLALRILLALGLIATFYLARSLWRRAAREISEATETKNEDRTIDR